MTLTEIFSILFIHWVGDFILQTDYDAKNKSTSISALLRHTVSYSFIIFFTIGILHGVMTKTGESNFWFCVIFTLITFISHTITDYYTSKLNKYLWEKGDVHNFFVSVGGDQILHYLQLFSLYYYLK